MSIFRWIIYKIGFNPKRGSILYSPSKDMIKAGKIFQKNFIKIMKEV